METILLSTMVKRANMYVHKSKNCLCNKLGLYMITSTMFRDRHDYILVHSEVGIHGHQVDIY